MSEDAFQNLTRDAFLGGRIHLWQPRRGYRAGIDPVLLAASVSAQAGQSVLDLGCGAGAAIICLSARVPGLVLTGVELQPDYGELANRNARENNIDMRVICADLTQLPAALRHEQFDHVIANPPYFRQGAHSPAADSGKRLALGEQTPLDAWVDVAARRLVHKGYLHVIQRVERLPDLIAACRGRVGSIEVLPFSAREGRAPELAILQARKGGRADFVLHAPVVLHSGVRHETDSDSYTPEIVDVLRNGKALNRTGPNSR